MELELKVKLLLIFVFCFILYLILLLDVIKWGLEAPGGVAIDWIHDLLFWTDAGTRRVEAVTFDGSLRAVIAASDLDKPRAIVVHPGEALVFWTDWGKINKRFLNYLFNID